MIKDKDKDIGGDLVSLCHSWLFLTNWETEIMTLGISDWQSESDLDSFRIYCHVFFQKWRWWDKKPNLSILSMCSQWAFLHCLNLEMEVKEIQFHLIIHSFILLGFNPSTRFKNQTCDTGVDCKIPQPTPDWWSEVAPEQSLSSSHNCCLRCFPLWPGSGHLSVQLGTCTCSRPWNNHISPTSGYSLPNLQTPPLRQGTTHLLNSHRAP